jgi:hypothetical protein
MELKKMFAKV